METGSKRLYGVLLAAIAGVVIISNFAATKISIFPIGGLDVDCGIYLFPLSFVLTDIFNDRFGVKEAHFASAISLVLNFCAMLYLTFAVKLPAAECYENQAAFASVFMASWRILLASTLAYLSHFIDNSIFESLRKNRSFFAASLISTVISQVIDSIVFEFVAFYGTMSTKEFFGLFGFALFAALIVDISFTIVITPLRATISRARASKEAKRCIPHDLDH